MATGGQDWSVDRERRPRSLNLEPWVLDLGFWTLDLGFWVLDLGFWTIGFWTLSGFLGRALDFLRNIEFANSINADQGPAAL